MTDPAAGGVQVKRLRLKRLSERTLDEGVKIKLEDEEKAEPEIAKEEEALCDDCRKLEEEEEDTLAKVRIEIAVKNGKRPKKDLGEEPRSKALGNCWRTPLRVRDMLINLGMKNEALFVGDACASAENTLFDLYYDEHTNAMQHPWFKGDYAKIRRGVRKIDPIVRCCERTPGNLLSYWYINCPYGKDRYKNGITNWLRKCALEARKGVGVVALVPAPNGEVDRWHHVFGNAECGVAKEVIYISGRLAFGDPETGEESTPAKFGCVLIHWDPRILCERCRCGPFQTRVILN
jgi:hypothetical protein